MISRKAAIVLLVTIWAMPLSATENKIPLDLIKDNLPVGWTAKSDGPSIAIIRKHPIWLYNPISLPPDREATIERIKYPHTVIFKLTCKPAISMKELLKMEKENENTDKALAEIEGRMRSFQDKGSYHPKILLDQAIYDEYQTKLKTLPYHALPDGRYADSMVYIESNIPHGYKMFYDTREKYDCLSVLARIYTIITPVAPHRLRFQFKEEQLSDILWGRRGWEIHASRKERDCAALKE